MSRINVGIPVSELHRKHLLAEHREIVRIPNMIKSGKAKVVNIPEKFVLGTGHVKFFYNKLKYLHKRYLELHARCLEKKYGVADYSAAFDNLPPHLYNDYTPTESDIALLRERIADRISKFKTK